MDIVDDVWRNIFGLLHSIQRAKLISVCKRWQDILKTPIFWKSIKWTQDQQVARSKLVPTTKSFIAFFLRYCQSIEDIILQIHLGEGSKGFLDQLFQIRSLRRVSLDIYVSDDLIDLSVTQSPLCKDLKLLNIRLNKGTIKGIDELVSALSNIEELYMNFDIELLPLSLAGLKKLERVGIAESKLSLLDSAPHIKLLVAQTASRTYNSVGRTFDGFGTTIVLQRESAYQHSISSILLPFLDPIEDEDIMLDPALSIDNLTYLVKERGFNINRAVASQFKFRPAFYCYGKNEDYPLKVAVISSDTDRISFLISLGADPNSPLEDDSPLLHARTSIVYNHLLTLGSDPNKLVKGIPVFMHLLLPRSGLTYLLDADLAVEKVLSSLVGRCDFNKTYSGRSFVDLALSPQSPSAALSWLLEKNHVRWTPDQLDALLNTKQTEFYRVISQPGFDLSSLKVVTLVRAMERLPSSVLVNALLSQKDYQQDADGLTLVHYLALINTATYGCANSSSSSTSFELHPQRWVSAVQHPTNPQTLLDSVFTSPLQGSVQPHDNPILDLLTGALITSNQAPPAQQSAVDLEELFSASSNHTLIPNTIPAESSNPLPGTPDNWVLQALANEPTPMRTVEELIARHKGAINTRSEFGETPLLILCKSSTSGDNKQRNTQLLLKYGADVNLADKHGWTPLHAALYLQHFDLARLLLEQGANINAQDEIGVTPLMALFYGYNAHKANNAACVIYNDSTAYDMISMLLKQKGIDFTLTDKLLNRSLTHLMACIATPELFELLLQNTSENVLEARDVDGFTPLHHAAMFCNCETMVYLIKRGANVNARSGGLRLTPLTILAAINNNVFSTTQWLTHSNTMMLSSPVETSLPTEPGWVARHRKSRWRVKQQHPLPCYITTQIKQYWQVLCSSADLSLTDSLGNTLLHMLVATKGKSLLEPSIITINLAEPTEWRELNHLWNHRNARGDTPFHLLLDICKGQEINVQNLMKLIENGNINLNLENNKGETCLQTLMLLRSLTAKEKSEVLNIAKQASFYKPLAFHKQKSSTTILHSMLQLSGVSINLNLFKSFLGRDTTEINARDEDGNTPLMALLQHVFVSGAPMNYTTRVRTKLQPIGSGVANPFAFAVQARQSESEENNDVYDSVDLWPIVDYLITCPGTNLNVQNNFGDTALHIVCRHFHIGALEAMLCNLNSCEQASKYCLIAFKLLDGGAQATIKNNVGETVVDYVPMLMSHYQHIYPLLKDYSALGSVIK